MTLDQFPSPALHMAEEFGAPPDVLEKRRLNFFCLMLNVGKEPMQRSDKIG
ncbi:hypothetical protein SBDP1_130014 [Syntrophobacter sp. SbD1]|nr:hypothetical protein SBDP1_130014 [Syntrophobacter sp. SbD1]